MKKLSGFAVAGLVILGLFLLIGFWGVGCYNGLVSLKESVNTQFSNVDVQLQRRSDLIPNIVNTVKGYTDHEANVLNQLSDSRAKLAGASTVSEKAAADSEMSSAISRLLVVVENYPTLKADTQFTSLMDNLEGTENRIAVARKDYNDAAQKYNQEIKKFPGVIVASMTGFESASLFQASEGASKVPEVNFNK